MIPPLHPLGSNTDVSIVRIAGIATLSAAFRKPRVRSLRRTRRSLPAGRQACKRWGDVHSFQNEMLNGKTLRQLPSVEDATVSGTTTASSVRSAIKHGAVELLPVQRGPWLPEGEESSRRWRAVLQSSLWAWEALLLNSAQSTEPAAFREEESKCGFVGCGTMGSSQRATTKKKKNIIIWGCVLYAVTICSTQEAMKFLISQEGCNGQPQRDALQAPCLPTCAS